LPHSAAQALGVRGATFARIDHSSSGGWRK
jgi:hypothetical protein